mgnify:CR=1 FL=1
MTGLESSKEQQLSGFRLDDQKAALAGGNAADDLPLPGAKEFSECQRYPRNKKVIINLKPDTELMAARAPGRGGCSSV